MESNVQMEDVDEEIDADTAFGAISQDVVEIGSAEDLAKYTQAEKLAALILPVQGKEADVVGLLRHFDNGRQYKAWISAYLQLIPDAVRFTDLDVKKVIECAKIPKPIIEKFLKDDMVDVRLYTPMKWLISLENNPAIKAKGCSSQGVLYQVLGSERIVPIDEKDGFQAGYEITDLVKNSLGSKVQYRLYKWDDSQICLTRALVAHNIVKIDGGMLRFVEQAFYVPYGMRLDAMAGVSKHTNSWAKMVHDLAPLFVKPVPGTDVADILQQVYAVVSENWHLVKKEHRAVIAAVVKEGSKASVTAGIVSNGDLEEIKSRLHNQVDDRFATDVNEAGQGFQNALRSNPLAMEMSSSYTMTTKLFNIPSNRMGAFATMEYIIWLLGQAKESGFTPWNVVILGTGAPDVNDVWGELEATEPLLRCMRPGAKGEVEEAFMSRTIYAPGKRTSVHDAETIKEADFSEGVPNLDHYLDVRGGNFVIVVNIAQVGEEELSEEKMYRSLMQRTVGYQGVFAFAFGLAGFHTYMEVVAAVYAQGRGMVARRHPKLDANAIWIAYGEPLVREGIDEMDYIAKTFAERSKVHKEVLHHFALKQLCLFWGVRPVNHTRPSGTVIRVLSAVFSAAKIKSNVARSARGVKSTEQTKNLVKVIKATRPKANNNDRGPSGPGSGSAPPQAPFVSPTYVMVPNLTGLQPPNPGGSARSPDNNTGDSPAPKKHKNAGKGDDKMNE